MNNGVWINSQSFCWLSATKSSSSQSVLLSYIFYWMLFLYQRARDSFFFKDEKREEEKNMKYYRTFKIVSTLWIWLHPICEKYFYFLTCETRTQIHKQHTNNKTHWNKHIHTSKIPPFLSDYDSIPFSRCVDFLNKPYSNEFYLIE